MAKAVTNLTTIRLSEVATDPVLRAFFARGEGDTGDAFAVPVTPRKPLDSSTVTVKREAHAYA